MRVDDNWALLQGCQAALQRIGFGGDSGQAHCEQTSLSGGAASAPALAAPPLVVAFNLVPQFLGAGARSFCFMLKVCHGKSLRSVGCLGGLALLSGYMLVHPTLQLLVAFKSDKA